MGAAWKTQQVNFAVSCDKGNDRTRQKYAECGVSVCNQDLWVAGVKEK